MTEVIRFIPKASLTASQNVEHFVSLCRNELAAFGVDLDFDDMVWNLSGHVEDRGRKTISAVFSKLGPPKRRGGTENSPLEEPFVSFAKAYIRYRHGIRPFSRGTLGKTMAALRSLEAALCEHGVPSVEVINGALLNRASQIIKERNSGSSAHGMSAILQRVAEFLDENLLVSMPNRWTSPIREPQRLKGRIGKEFEERRSQMLPSQEVLDALAEIHAVAQHDADIIVTSVVALMLGAPDRISEVLTLPEDCEVRQRDSSGKDMYGLRWWPAKGAPPMVKWIIPSMAEVIQAAIAKIRKATVEARKIARWYEVNPSSLYLPDHLEHLRRKEWLSTADVVEICDYGDGAAARYLFKQAGIQSHKPVSNGMAYVRFSELEAAVVAMLPKGFPVLDSTTGLKFGDALFVVRRGTMRTGRVNPMPVMLEHVSYERVRFALSGNEKGDSGSIFQRHEKKAYDGTPLRIRSHQFRHFLNTLAQVGGLDQMDIAKWSGRLNIHQNAAYDHESGQEIIDRVRKAVGDQEGVLGSLATISEILPISKDTFARLQVPTAHVTEYGYCVHDFTASPCQSFRDCLRCSEHLCVKGDPKRADALRRRLEQVRELLDRAEQAATDGEIGADRWVEVHRETVLRLEGLVAIIDDDSVPDGTVIQTADPQLAIENSQAKLTEPVEATAPAFDALEFMGDN